MLSRMQIRFRIKGSLFNFRVKKKNYASGSKKKKRGILQSLAVFVSRLTQTNTV